MSNPRFFWIGEESEIFVAQSIRQLARDNGHSGTGVGRWEDHPDRGVLLFDEENDPLEWGELDPIGTRMWMWNCDENERPLGMIRGNLFDLHAWTDGGRYNMPVLFSTQYA